MTVGVHPQITVQIMDGPQLPDLAELQRSGWVAAALSLSPQSLRVTAADRRLATRWVVARRGPTLVGVLPMYELKRQTAPDAIYDPRTVAPKLFGHLPDDAHNWTYIGGLLDLVAGVTLSAACDNAERSGIRQALVAAASQEAARLGRQPVVLYVRDEEVADFRAGLGPDAVQQEITGFAILDLPGSSAEEYLRGLDKKRRYRVRTEWQELNRLGLRATVAPVEDVVDQAASLVVNVKARHGVIDHPRLIAMRIRGWAAGRGAEEFHALQVHDADGTLLGVSFVARHGDCVELHEMGLADSPHRHLVYTELLIHAPVRYATERGATRLKLGLKSPEPKVLRGARLEPVWALTDRAAPPTDLSSETAG